MALAAKHAKGIEIEIGGNTTKLKNALDTANRTIKTTQRELDTLQNSLKLEWNADNFKRAQELAQRAVKQTAEKAEMLKRALAELEKQGITDANTEQYEAIKRELSYVQVAAQKAATELQALNNIKLDQLQERLEKTSQRLKSMGDAVMPLSAAMTAGLVGAGKAAIDFEDAMAGVAKTTDLTERELADMGDQIRAIALEVPKSAKELAGITEAAGQLGISKENLVSFTRTIADLDVATDMAGETAAMTLAQFANITQMDQGNFDRLGSTIVDLGNNLATTESKIADMAQRLAAAGNQAGMTEADILAISGTLSSLGVESQAGGTAFSKVINEINVAVQTGSKRMGEFAEVAGMSAKEFATAWQTDAAGALVAFTEGLGDVERTGKSAVVMLEDMEITEVRMRDALTRAAGAGGLFRDSLNMASQAWEENIALTNEAARKYEITASQLQLAKNEIIDVGIELGGTLLPLIRSGTGAVKDFTEWFRNLDDAAQKNVLRLIAMTAALAPMLKLVGLAAGAGATAVKTYAALAPLLEALKLKLLGAAGAQEVLNVAMASNPVGAVITAIGVLTAVVTSFGIANALTADKTETLNDKIKDTIEASEREVKSIRESTDAKLNDLTAVSQLIPQIEALNSKKERSAEEQHRLNGLVATANTLYPGLIGQIDAQTGSYDINTAAINNNIAALTTQYQMEANQEVILEKLRTKAELLNLLAQKEIEHAETLGRIDDIEDRIASAGRWDERKSAMEDLQAVQDNLVRQAEEMVELDEQISKLDEDAQSLIEANVGLSDSLNNNAAALDRAGASAALTDDQISRLSGSTVKLISDVDALRAAMEEQTATGSISVETARALEAAGYAAAISIDQETGAAWLNAEAYANLATQKINEQKASVADSVRTARAAALDAERAAVEALASGNFVLAASYRAVALAMSAKAKAGEDDLAGLEAALSAMQKPISIPTRPTVGGGSGSKRSGGGGRSSKAKTQAEKDLEAYKAALEQLDYQRNMDLISEEKYYQEMAALRDRYLKDNLKERQAADVAIHKYQKKAAEDHAKAEADALKAAYEDKLADIKYYQDMGLMSEENYYKSLEALRDAYLEKDSEAWRRVTVEIHNFVERQREESLKAAQKALEAAQKEREATLKRYTEQRIAALKAEQEAEEKRLRGIIDGINEEIAARRRLREEQSDEDAVSRAKKKLEAAQFQLSFARDDYTRAELQKEVIRAQEAYQAAVQAKEDRDWEYSKQQEIKALQDDLAVTKERAQEQIANAEQWAADRLREEQREANRAARAQEREAAAQMQKTASGAMAGAAQAVAGAVQNITNSITNHNIATITTGASMLTSGQLTRVVEKAIEKMGR